jgi:hypothetical protein
VRALAIRQVTANPHFQAVTINAGIGLIIVSFLAFFEETGCP